MMTELLETLSRIEAGLERLGRKPLLRLMKPGLNLDEIRGQPVAAGLGRSVLFEELHSWRDGTLTTGVTLDDIQMFPGFYLLSLEEAIANYRAFTADSRWDRGWLPLFANGGGDFYVVDFEPRSMGEIRHFRIEESENPVEFRSLSNMMETLAAAFDRGVFYVDPDRYLEMDDLRFAALARELNPDIAWWIDSDPTAHSGDRA
ncbi:SMI1/KNR4 family protein [Leifsonia sp. NPDC058230]|uniref:SMI1/KNR4 family protein n=1 Tax=Leifsonia sp. NPDC058230 TaxID=3346391 RepID=UPI0036DDEACF